MIVGTFNFSLNKISSVLNLNNWLIKFHLNQFPIFRFIERYSQMGSGRVNQAFAGALTAVLKDYYIFVAQLERQHRLGQLTLNKVNDICLRLSNFDEKCRF